MADWDQDSGETKRQSQWKLYYPHFHTRNAATAEIRIIPQFNVFTSSLGAVSTLRWPLLISFMQVIIRWFFSHALTHCVIVVSLPQHDVTFTSMFVTAYSAFSILCNFYQQDVRILYNLWTLPMYSHPASLDAGRIIFFKKILKILGWRFKIFYPVCLGKNAKK